MKNRIFLATPHMGGHEQRFVQEAFDTNWIAPLGANVDGFEQEISAYAGVKSGAALSSGTAALHMALKALGVEQGDIVFCSSLTFSASVNPVIYQGAIPVFIDSEYQSWNMDPKALEKAFEKYPNPKAVIVVNLYGQSADMDRILPICEAHGVPVVEDAAESLGSTYRGKKSGTLGQYGVYSFNGNKIITTSGGGMLVSNHEEKIRKVRFWSCQSREPKRHYEHKELGYNYRMSNIVAGIGRGQLLVLEERIKQKQAIYERYKAGFAHIPEISMMPLCDYGVSNCWLSCLLLSEDSRVKPLTIIETLEKENIESRPIWNPMHLQPYFEKYEFFTAQEGTSVSEDIYNRGLCLPSDTKMTLEEQQLVIDTVKSCFA